MYFLTCQFFSEIIRTYVDEHKAFFDSNAIHDFIDAYIYEQRFGGNDACGFSVRPHVTYHAVTITVLPG